ncbi:hypothetical protein RHGRI_002558 [Rhododendron griersonianum]|uniref:Uncharacterized protein n=1 Tax=Rhododendron griersonianum TaxID=479676 RepID=A0AAV6LQJ3_9ERIC|nr:hypothetical protein RHGRI_002558 [Rhododendron griersonianum]
MVEEHHTMENARMGTITSVRRPSRSWPSTIPNTTEPSSNIEPREAIAHTEKPNPRKALHKTASTSTIANEVSAANGGQQNDPDVGRANQWATRRWLSGRTDKNKKRKIRINHDEEVAT